MGIQKNESCAVCTPRRQPVSATPRPMLARSPLHCTPTLSGRLGMDNIIMLFVCLALGMALRKSGRLPDNAHTSINGFIVHVSLPALTLLQIHSVKLDPALF